MRRYRQDPYWTQVRFTSQCRKCGRTILRGGDIYYYPRIRIVYCGGECGQAASRDFEAMALDEDLYNQY